MDARSLRHARFWLNACIVGMVVWGCSLLIGDHLPRHTTTPGNLVQVAAGVVGAALWTGAGWRTVRILQRSGVPIMPCGKALVFGLGSVVVLQEVWIILLLLIPDFLSARVMAEANLLIATTFTLAGVVYWNTPMRT
jgi:hypothetical protein